MLFDLRSRGRRRTVQVVYIGLAILIGAGLVLFGVGTGSGGGGLFGAFTGSGSSGSGADKAINSETRSALAQTKKDPGSATAWADLVNARFSAANSAGYDTTTSSYTAAGRTQLNLLTYAYGRYSELVTSPSSDTTTIAAEAYSALSQYATAAAAYQTVLQSEPGNVKGLECVSLLSYAAGNDRVGQLAETEVLSKLPKNVRNTTRTTLEAAKTQKTSASQACG